MGGNHEGRAKAYTLVEALVVIATIAILAAVAIPAISLSKKNAEDTQISANLKTFNTFATQMRSAGFTNAGSSGNDKEAALAFYLNRGWIRPVPRPDISKLTFEEGVWKKTSP